MFKVIKWGWERGFENDDISFKMKLVYNKSFGESTF